MQKSQPKRSPPHPHRSEIRRRRPADRDSSMMTSPQGRGKASPVRAHGSDRGTGPRAGCCCPARLRLTHIKQGYVRGPGGPAPGLPLLSPGPCPCTPGPAGIQIPTRTVARTRYSRSTSPCCCARSLRLYVPPHYARTHGPVS